MEAKYIEQTSEPSDGVSAKQTIEVIEGEHLDTQIELSGSFTVSGKQKEEFLSKLGKLINEYRI